MNMTLPEAIGGYFGWEIQPGEAYHKNIMALNTGRNAFEYILRARGYRHVYIPYYTCDAVLEPLVKLNIGYDFYSINEKLEPENLTGIKQGSAFLYTNYFGLKSAYIKNLATLLPNLVIDASQAFFEMPVPAIDSFYSPRKFFGVPDGGYVSCAMQLQDDFEEDSSIGRISHLVKRIDKGAEEGYADFKINEASLCHQPIKKMSKLTRALLNSINFQECLRKRNENFLFLHSSLKERNGFKWLEEETVNGAMNYPFYSTDRELRKRLIDQKIYLAEYWPNVREWANESSIEFKLVENVLPLPVDHRYGEQEMKKIISVING